MVAQPFDLDGHKVSVGTSIGIALAPQDGVEPDELLKKADLALYRTKSEGRNGFNFFHADMTAEADARHRAGERDARGASRATSSSCTISRCSTSRRASRAAPRRWCAGGIRASGLIAPDRFIPLAEDTGLIVQLGGWILQKGLRRRGVLAGAHQARRQPVAGAVPQGRPVRRHPVRAGRVRPAARAARARDHRVGPARERGELSRRCSSSSRTSASRSCSTTSAPAIRRSATSRRSRSTRSRSTSRSPRGCRSAPTAPPIIASVLTLARGLDIATTAEGVETEEQFEHAARGRREPGAGLSVRPARARCRSSDSSRRDDRRAGDGGVT